MKQLRGLYAQTFFTFQTTLVYIHLTCAGSYIIRNIILHRMYINTFHSSGPSFRSHINNLKMYYTRCLQHCLELCHMCFKQSTAVNTPFYKFSVSLILLPKSQQMQKSVRIIFTLWQKMTLFETTQFEFSNILHVGKSKISLLCDVDHMKLWDTGV